MVRLIRNVELSMGDGIKKPSCGEKKNLISIRKSMVAKLDIKKGEVFTKYNITTKRPGLGISPMNWNNMIGRVSKRNFLKDEMISLR